MAGSALAERHYDVVLVLGGGNALGAFHAGVFQAMDEADLLPDWVVGASIGAINGAIIAGTSPGGRLDALRSFWAPAGGSAASVSRRLAAFETIRRTAAVGLTLMAGKPGIFGPPLSSLAPWTDERPSVFETNQLAATLDRIVDFDRLNGGDCRYTATAVDLETGDDVVFDSREQRIETCHIRASAALPVAFPPVEIDGRLLVDAGLSANLPLDPVLANPARPTFCLAVDLLPLGGQALPRTLGEAASRMQDLIFAAQSRRTIERWQAAHADSGASVSLVRVAYSAQADEVAGKAMDFSPVTVEQRWAAGLAAGREVVGRLVAGEITVGQPGLKVFAG